MDNRKQFEDYYIKWEKALEDGVFDPNKPQTITEEDVSVDEAKKTDLSNPVQPTSVGQDSLVTDDSLEATYTPEDISKLEELKIQLHGLADKMAEMKEDPKLAKKISTLENKINDLSNEMNVVSKK